MIFKENILKKLMVTAYKTTGLNVARTQDDYIIGASYWAIRIHKDVLTNKAKAALVELIGALPEEGESWTVTPDSAQVNLDVVKDPADYIKLKMENYEVTNTLNDQNGTMARVLMNTETFQHVFVNELFIEMVTSSNLNDELGEMTPEGPLGTGKALIWQNNYSILVVYQRTGGEDGDRLVDILTAAALTETEEKA